MNIQLASLPRSFYSVSPVDSVYTMLLPVMAMLAAVGAMIAAAAGHRSGPTGTNTQSLYFEIDCV
jgi:hypothetical protein